MRLQDLIEQLVEISNEPEANSGEVEVVIGTPSDVLYIEEIILDDADGESEYTVIIKASLESGL